METRKNSYKKEIISILKEKKAIQPIDVLNELFINYNKRLEASAFFNSSHHSPFSVKKIKEEVEKKLKKTVSAIEVIAYTFNEFVKTPLFSENNDQYPLYLAFFSYYGVLFTPYLTQYADFAEQILLPAYQEKKRKEEKYIQNTISKTSGENIAIRRQAIVALHKMKLSDHDLDQVIDIFIKSLIDSDNEIQKYAFMGVEKILISYPDFAEIKIEQIIDNLIPILDSSFQSARYYGLDLLKTIVIPKNKWETIFVALMKATNHSDKETSIKACSILASIDLPDKYKSVCTQAMLDKQHEDDAIFNEASKVAIKLGDEKAQKKLIVILKNKILLKVSENFCRLFIQLEQSAEEREKFANHLLGRAWFEFKYPTFNSICEVLMAMKIKGEQLNSFIEMLLIIVQDPEINQHSVNYIIRLLQKMVAAFPVSDVQSEQIFNITLKNIELGFANEEYLSLLKEITVSPEKIKKLIEECLININIGWISAACKCLRSIKHIPNDQQERLENILLFKLTYNMLDSSDKVEMLKVIDSLSFGVQQSDRLFDIIFERIKENKADFIDYKLLAKINISTDHLSALISLLIDQTKCSEELIKHFACYGLGMTNIPLSQNDVIVSALITCLNDQSYLVNQTACQALREMHISYQLIESLVRGLIFCIQSEKKESLAISACQLLGKIKIPVHLLEETLKVLLTNFTYSIHYIQAAEDTLECLKAVSTIDEQVYLSAVMEDALNEASGKNAFRESIGTLYDYLYHSNEEKNFVNELNQVVAKNNITFKIA